MKGVRHGRPSFLAPLLAFASSTVNLPFQVRSFEEGRKSPLGCCVRSRRHEFKRFLIFFFFLLQSFQQNALRHLNTGVPSVFSPKITKIGSKYKKSKKKTFSKCFSRNPIKEIKSATNNIRLVPIFVVIKRTSYTLITPEQV